MEEMYGKDYFKNTWENWVDAMINFEKTSGGNICKDLLPAVVCPTLIIHGAKDAIVPGEHPEYLHNCIKTSK